MRSVRQLLVVAATLAIVAASAGTLAAPAAAQASPPPIQPNQYFAGEVNGNIASSVLSVLGCPPPGTPTSNPPTGYPMPGQSVSARWFPVPPPVAFGSHWLGYTGQAHKIRVDLVTSLANPPLVSVTPITTLVGYGVPVPISRFLSLPCNATYRMVFTPLDGGRSAVRSRVDLTLASPTITIVPTPLATPAPLVFLRGSGFVPSTGYAITECRTTSWFVPQDPCLGANRVNVTTDASGSFTRLFDPAPCTRADPAICWIGAPVPTGVDVIELSGAVRIAIS